MGAETLVYTALSTDLTVSAIVGDRISPNVVGEKVPMPAVCYNRTDTDYIVTIHSALPVGDFVLLDIWCMAKTEDEASSLADAAIDALATAFITPTNRRHEYDPDTEITAVVVTVRV
jgi:hypothetical protein